MSKKSIANIKNTLPTNVTLIAASKKQTIDSIRNTFNSGITHFGENYVQELTEKAEQGAFKNCTVHFIGAIQSRKCSDIVKYSNIVHTVDRLKIANALNKACQQQSKAINVFIQVNLSKEPSKAGCLESELPELVSHIAQNAPNLNLVGLMTFPPKGEGRPYYKHLKQLAERFNLPNLSMGTSGDYEDAVEEGATHIRLGTTIFGERT